MPVYECCTCGKKSDNKKDFYDVGARVGSNKICRDCAAELGFNNFFSVGFHSSTGLLKNYVKLHPEAEDRLNHQMLLIGKENQEIKKELGQMKADITKHKEMIENNLEVTVFRGPKSTLDLKCKDCGFVFTRNSKSVKDNPSMKCPRCKNGIFHRCSKVNLPSWNDGIFLGF